MFCYFDTYENSYEGVLKNKEKHYIDFGKDTFGNITRMDNLLDKIPEILSKEEVKKPFSKSEVLKEKREKLNKLNGLIEKISKNKKKDFRNRSNEKELIR